MKKIILSLALIGLTIGGVTAATVAYFSDTAAITGNTFSSGTLDLKIDANPSGATYQWEDGFANSTPFANLFPGSHGEQIIDIKNVGTVAGSATIKFDATTWSALGDNLYFTVYYDGNHDGVFDSAIATGSLAAWNHNTYVLGPITGTPDDGTGTGTLASVKIAWDVPTSAVNNIQGQSVTIDAVFGLEQTH
jgi:predicted ribosomally synthesized peptide with SipW-like signal peptide